MPTDNKTPAKYICSITGQIMIDPVIATDGYTYEREAIEEWLQTHDTSPRTNEKLAHKRLTANHSKHSNILDFLESHEPYEEDEVYLPKAWVTECVMAIKQNQIQVVQRWLDKDKRLLTLKLEGNSTALHLACEFSSPELVDTLLKISKQRSQSVMPGAVGFKPIHLNALLERALNSGDYVQCELLLRLGAEVEQPEISSQNTLLHRMVINDNSEAVSWLLDQKAVLESRNSDGNTPLLLSVIQRNANFAEFLLKKNANPQVKNAKDENPFYIAVEKGDIETAKLLFAYGANPAVSCGLTQLSTLHIAASHGDVEMLRYLLKTRAGALIDVQNAKDDTPLHLAVQAEHESIILLLLEAGAYHKIKNGQGQTPIELAMMQQKPKLANLIVQTVERLKQGKLKETNRVNQVVAEQASEIVDLKNALQSQGQGFKSLQSNMQAKIEKLEHSLQSAAPRPLISSSPTLIFRPPSPSINFHISTAVPKVDQKEVEEFLRLVAEGEQDKAEEMLKTTPDLALVPGDVTDLSKRTFTGITGFQYAVWALDWHMWTMIRKYLPDAAREQAQGLETGSWVKTHGIHANLNTLIQAYQTTIDLYYASKSAEADKAWLEQVGGAQLLLPAHVINEYCHPTRPFHPHPNFKEALALPRSRTIAGGEWFTTAYAGGKLGEKFAFYRGSRAGLRVGLGDPMGLLSRDAESVRLLVVTRTAQREELMAELMARRVKRKAA